MYNPSQHGRAALAGLAAGSLLLLAACGSDPEPVSGSDTGSDTETTAPAGDSGSGNKTIVFSPLALKIPAMQALSEGVKGYGASQGYEVLVQDPDLNPQKQVTDLESVIDSGRVAGAWAITIAPEAAAPLVQKSLDADVPLILNGTPEDYGLDGLEPGVSFSTIDYTAQGQAMGEELGNCINERLDGTAKVIFGEAGPGTAGKQEIETATMEALAATAPDAEIVTNVTISDRAAAQTDIGNALQGNPDAAAVMGLNDEGALGALGAFAAAGKDLTCVVESGGNEEVLAAVEAGKIYASVALQFEADMVQSFDTLVAMIDDPTVEGVQLTVPQEVIKAEG